MKENIQLSDHFDYKRLIRFVIPSVVMMIFTSIYGVIDGLFVSNFVGKTPFAAINLIFPLVMILGGFQPRLKPIKMNRKQCFAPLRAVVILFVRAIRAFLPSSPSMEITWLGWLLRQRELPLPRWKCAHKPHFTHVLVTCLFICLWHLFCFCILLILS